MKNLHILIIITFLLVSLVLVFSCKTQKQVSGDIYHFKNQKLTFVREFDFQQPDAKEDSTMIIYSNDKNITFQVRILKSDKMKVFEMMDSIDKCSFRAKKREKQENSYIIQLESLEY